MLLDLMCHNLCINQFRPFVYFNQATILIPAADKLTTRCATHCHSVHLRYELGTSTLIGFAIAYPQHALVTEVRHVIYLSMIIFKIFARSLPATTREATIARDLGSPIDVLTKQTQEKASSTQRQAENVPASPASWTPSGLAGGDVTGSNPNINILILPDSTAGTRSGDTAPMWAGPIDMAFAVDTEDPVCCTSRT
ncbi:hypothetical protein M434DRAFT_34817 [Hypoxylon sp. CO27-5]|nr:hypothetical protein M434DRAFT_34817 [Hypoxylon sp. CO27-5]